jgi:hypothetical protein
LDPQQTLHALTPSIRDAVGQDVAFAAVVHRDSAFHAYVESLESFGATWVELTIDHEDSPWRLLPGTYDGWRALFLGFLGEPWGAPTEVEELVERGSQEAASVPIVVHLDDDTLGWTLVERGLAGIRVPDAF